MLLFLSACSDNATVVKYDETLKPLKCLRLVVFPPDAVIEESISKLYEFDDSCEYRLEVSKRGSIVCNSNQNADKKALSSCPSGYIRMDVYRAQKPVYSYYKDLSSVVSEKDVTLAFERLREDIL